jgi:serine/threonine protein kinase
MGALLLLCAVAVAFLPRGAGQVSRAPSPTSTPTPTPSTTASPSSTPSFSPSSTPGPVQAPFCVSCPSYRLLFDGEFSFWEVPADGSQPWLHVQLIGGGGGVTSPSNQKYRAAGGNGAYVSGVLRTVPGETLRIVIGAGGMRTERNSYIAYDSTLEQYVWPPEYGDVQSHGGITCGGGGRTAVQRQASDGTWVDVATAGGGGGAYAQDGNWHPFLVSGHGGDTEGARNVYDTNIPARINASWDAEQYGRTLNATTIGTDGQPQEPCSSGYPGFKRVTIPATYSFAGFQIGRGICWGGSGSGFCRLDAVFRRIDPVDGGTVELSAGGTSFKGLLQCAVAESIMSAEDAARRYWSYDTPAGVGASKAQGIGWTPNFGEEIVGRFVVGGAHGSATVTLLPSNWTPCTIVPGPALPSGTPTPSPTSTMSAYPTPGWVPSPSPTPGPAAAALLSFMNMTSADVALQFYYDFIYSWYYWPDYMGNAKGLLRRGVASALSNLTGVPIPTHNVRIMSTTLYDSSGGVRMNQSIASRRLSGGSGGDSVDVVVAVSTGPGLPPIHTLQRALLNQSVMDAALVDLFAYAGPLFGISPANFRVSEALLWAPGSAGSDDVLTATLRLALSIGAPVAACCICLALTFWCCGRKKRLAAAAERRRWKKESAEALRQRPTKASDAVNAEVRARAVADGRPDAAGSPSFSGGTPSSAAAPVPSSPFSAGFDGGGPSLFPSSVLTVTRSRVGEALGSGGADVERAAAAAAGFAAGVGDSAAAAVVLAGASTVLEAVGNSLPVVGSALVALGAVFRQVERMRASGLEAGVLSDRVGRLQSVVQAAAAEPGFAEAHAAIFESMVAGLEKAYAELTVVADRSVLGAFAYASRDMQVLQSVDRMLSSHLSELTAAMQAHTMTSVRAIQDGVTAIAASAQQREEKGKEPQPLPPFSMRFSLADIAFDPPLEVQLETAPQGSYGVVVFGIWRAERLPVAVKLLPARGFRGEQLISIMTWLSEAELMRRLREFQGQGRVPEHVVLLYGIGAQEGPRGPDTYLVVMERMEGSLREALDAYLAKGRTPALATALGWLLDIARGIAECHSCQVVHSDVKSANVLLDGRRRAKVGDLGTARVTRGITATLTRGGTATAVGSARGSPLWLAPEMVADSDVSPGLPSDVYNWAITAWEVLTCRLPYHDAAGVPTVNVDKLSARNAIVQGVLRPDLGAVRPDAPRKLLGLLQRSWASDPRDRPDTATLVRELEAIVGEAAASPRSPLASADSSASFLLPGSVPDGVSAAQGPAVAFVGDDLDEAVRLVLGGDGGGASTSSSAPLLSTAAATTR